MKNTKFYEEQKTSIPNAKIILQIFKSKKNFKVKVEVIILGG